MKIPVLKIPIDGLELSQTYDPKEWDMDRDGLKVVSPIKATAFINKDEKNIFVHLTVTTGFEVECACCLKKFEIPVEENFDLDYNIKGKTTLDITSDIRQEMILEYPIKPLCDELCKGLCPKCGKNLNNGKCNCK